MKQHREVWKGLIAIEGIDGAGTTTLSKLLSEALEAKGRPHECGKEPTDGPIGQLIRSALSGKISLTPDSLAMLFAADRREHLYGHQGIRQVLDSGAYYLSDRYFFSSLAYQGIESHWDWVYSLNQSYPLPEYLIFLDLPVEDALRRIEGRAAREIFEYQDIQLKVAENYRRSIDMFRDSHMKLLELDGRQPPESVCAQVLEFINP